MTEVGLESSGWKDLKGRAGSSGSSLEVPAPGAEGESWTGSWWGDSSSHEQGHCTQPS